MPASLPAMEVAVSLEPRTARPPLALGALVLLALAGVALHASGLTAYGWFRDELYYLSCAKRLAWGYVDHPPLSVAALALLRAVAGDSLAAMRIAIALVTACAVVTTGALTRELGGGRWAQLAAAGALAIAPFTLGTGHYWSMNAFDLLFWVAGTWCALRAFRGGAREWLVLGAVLGLGLLDKWSIAWLGAGIAVALVLSPARRALRTPWPWLAALLAAAIVAPNLFWQAGHGWPTLEFMRHASEDKMKPLDLAGLIGGQILLLGPGAALVWIAGLAVALRREGARPVAIVWLVTLALLAANGSARAGYLALAGPGLLAAGAVWWEGRGRLARVAIPALAVLLALPLAPFAMPVLPVERFVAWQKALGREPKSEERHRMGALPQHFADMFGWPELADSVARVSTTLTAAERARAIVLVNNYGEAGALERFGAGRVPAIACEHNHWFYWPPAWDGGIAIVVGRDSADIASEFESVVVAGRAGHPLAMPYEQDLPILVARGYRGDVPTAWARGKHFD